MSLLAKRVQQRRESLGLSQSELARRLDVSPQSIQSLESGRTKSFRKIMELAAALAVPVAYFTMPDPEPMTVGADDMTTSLHQFGRRIAAARRKLGLSIADAARGVMDPALWDRMEAGEHWPLPSVLDAVCNTVDEPADYLVRGMAAAPRNADLLPEAVTLHQTQRRFGAAKDSGQT